MNRQILPTNVKPLHYDVFLKPGLETFEFDGRVSVKLMVVEATKVITTNALEVVVSKAFVDDIQSSSIVHDTSMQTVSMEFDTIFTVGSTITLLMEFKGIHNDQMAGFYRSGYVINGVKKYMAVTQCCATDCRRCFPCWDEPALKATFEITLEIPKDRIGLSNMNFVTEKDLGATKLIQFAMTPIMSTYLLCIVVGEFDYLEAIATPKSPANAKPVQCRVYTLPGQQELGRYALGISTRTLEYFSQYFDIAYPLPKLDMVAIPDFGVGAMENWGLVTYREQALLFDAEKSSAKAKERVAYTVAHEISHQWFGNVVSPKWWSDIWLNEGFATIVGWQAIDEFFKSWDVFTSFVIGNFAAGQSLDSMRSSHPVEVEANTPADIAQIFDAISYSKGASVIRMLNNYLGVDIFAQGVQKYLKAHLYGNATTVDLWNALSAASGQDIQSMMHNWIQSVGFPVVSVDEEVIQDSFVTLLLSQERFLASGDLTDKERSETPVWQIPITVTTHEGDYSFLFKENSGKITFPFNQSGKAFWKLNSNSNGFYRVLLHADQIKKLGEVMLFYPNALTNPDKIGLVSDAFALSKAGLCPTTDALSLIQYYKKEESPVVLQEVVSKLSALKEVWSQDVVAVECLQAIQRSIFSPLVEKVGYEYSENDDYLTTMKRTLVIQASADAKDKQVIQELLNRFKKYQKGQKDAFHPNLRGVVFKCVLLYSDDPNSDFDAIFDIYKNGATVDERLVALACLGAVNDLAIVKRLLEMVLDSDIVKPQDIRTPLQSLAMNPCRKQVLELLWNWLTSNWLVLYEKLGSGLNLLGAVVQACISLNVGEKFIVQVQEWMQGKGLDPIEQALRQKQVNDAKRAFEQSLETIKGATMWYNRDGALVSKWLSKQSFK